MRRNLLFAALVCAVIAGCSGPPEAADPTALFTDHDLEVAAALGDMTSLTLSSIDSAMDPLALLNDSFGASRTLDAVAVEALATGTGKKTFSAGGYLVYVEQNGSTYSIRLAKLDDEITRVDELLSR